METIIQTEEAFLEEQIKVLREKGIDNETLKEVTTVDSLEKLLWESSHQKLNYMSYQQKAILIVEIYKFRKSTAQELEPDLSIRYDLTLMINQLEEEIWDNSATVNNLKKGNIAQTIYYLRKKLKAFNNDGNLNDLKPQVLSLLGVIERNGLLYKYKHIISNYLQTLELIGITLFNEL